MTEQRDTTQPAGGSPVERGVRPHAARLDVLRVLLAERHPEHHAAVAEAQAELERLRECLQWLQERHRGGLMRAKIDEALGAKLRAEWSKPGGLMDGPIA